MRITLTAACLALMVPYFLNATQPFITEKFDQGFPANWTTGDDSNQNFLWEYCSNFQNCPPAIFQTDPVSILCRYDRFESASVEDGFLYLNSYASQGISTPHQSFIKTGNIDCSLKTKVFLRFYTVIVGGESLPEDNAVVRVRVGNGNWTIFKVFHFLDENSETQTSSNPRVAVIDISGVATQKDDVTIEWRWTGKNGYFWAIDDVELFDENPVYENAVWGSVPGQGDFSGGLNNWTVNTVGAPCKWQWDNTGGIDVPDANLLADAVGCSPSILNGTASVNATFCYGGAIPNTRSDLRSPVIDLSAIPVGTRLALRFDQLVSLANPSSNNLPVTSIMVSVDGGSTFLDTIDANPSLPYRVHSCGTTTLDLPIEAAGSPNFRIIFVFSGDSEFWMVDDVRIIKRWDKDLRISKDFFTVAPNYSSPAGLASPVGLQADVENIGQEPVGNVALYATVEAGQTGAIVFRDTLQMGTLMPGEIVLDTFFAKQFHPPASAETYTVKYEVKSNELEQDASDNVVRWKFETTTDLFSKDKGDCFINGSFTPYDEFEFEIGNCFFIPPGSNVGATEISFAFEVPFSPQPSSLIGIPLRIHLYKWRTANTWGDVNGDSLATADEITEVAVQLYTIEGDERYYQVRTVPVTEDSAFIHLEDSTYYFATIGIENYAGPDRLFVSASEELNYTSMYWTSYQQGFPNYVSMLRLGDDNYFQVNGWGLQRIPIVRLHIDQLTSTNEAPSHQASELSVFPNPAKDVATIILDEKMAKGPANVEILDIWGRLVLARQYDNTFVSQLPIDVSGLSNGMYILRVISEKYSASTSLVIVKD